MTRHPIVTEKIGRDRTDLRGAIYVHISHDGKGKIYDVSLSHKWKDIGTMDKILSVIGETLTDDARANAVVDRFLAELEASEKAAK